MNMKDIHSRSSAVLAFGPGVLSADNTPGAIDLRGFTAAEILLAIGAGGITFDSTNKIEFVLTHSDDDVTYTNVATADVRGGASVTNGIIKALTAAHAAAAVYRFGYVGGKRYIKLLADFSGTHGTGTGLSAVVFRDLAQQAPTANQS